MSSTDSLSGAHDKEFYAKSVDYLGPESIRAFRQHITEVKIYLDAAAVEIRELDRLHGPLKIVELGAGTCLTSLLIKKMLGRGTFTCVDISASRMNALAARVAAEVGSDNSNFNFVEADFTFTLPFETGAFDVVIFDAALHHSRNIWTTLSEARRIVKNNGTVIALREAYLSRFTYKISMQRLQDSPEFAAGVAENAYLKEQYDYYFRFHSLTPEFIPVFSNWKWKILSIFNGLLIGKYVIVSKPVPLRL